MRVLHYISGISPVIGGIEKFVLNFYDAQKDNIEMQILTRHCDNSTIMSKMFEKRGIVINSLNIHHLTISTLINFRYNLEKFFSEHACEFDILHTHCIEDPFVCAIAKKYGLTKIVAHVHSYRSSVKSFANFIKSISIKKNSGLSYACLACSLEVGQKVYPSKEKNKIVMIPNGIDARKFDFDPTRRNEIRKQLKLDESFVVCNVGRLEAVKNHCFLLDIFEELLSIHQDSKLVLVGNGSLKNELQVNCKERGISNKVLFLGDRKDVNFILQAADAFVFTSKNEGLGIVAIEAQAAGLKTIVSSGVIPEEIKVTDLVSFISLNDSPKKWATLILLSALNYKRKSRYDEIVNSGFDYKMSSESLVKIYKQGM